MHTLAPHGTATHPVSMNLSQ